MNGVKEGAGGVIQSRTSADKRKRDERQVKGWCIYPHSFGAILTRAPSHADVPPPGRWRGRTWTLARYILASRTGGQETTKDQIRKCDVQDTEGEILISESFGIIIIRQSEGVFINVDIRTTYG